MSEQIKTLLLIRVEIIVKLIDMSLIIVMGYLVICFVLDFAQGDTTLQDSYPILFVIGIWFYTRKMKE